MAPSFLAFFSKRENARSPHKYPESPTHSQPSHQAALPPISSTTSPSIGGTSEQLEGSQLSLETEYVLAEADSPTRPSSIYPRSIASNASASTTKIKMPFRRKKSKSTYLLAPPIQDPVPSTSTSNGPRNFSMESSLSESPSLLPPPSRSAIFGSYATSPNALSTRSLPQATPFVHSRQSSHDMSQNYETMSNPDFHLTPPPPTVVPPAEPPTKGRIFSWARPRARTKSKPDPPKPSVQSSPPSPPVPPPVPRPPPADSFNLKSFRHITPLVSLSPTPEQLSPSPSSSKIQGATPRLRTRENSFASDASQRISVAAFREVQARRSTTESPVQSSSGDPDGSVSGQVQSRRRSSTFGTPPPLPTSGSQPTPRTPPTRTSIASLFMSSAITSSDSSEEGESESEQEPTLRPNRQRTMTNRPPGGTQSELGHRSSPIFSSTRSDVGHGTSSSPRGLASPSPRSAGHSNSTNVEVSEGTDRNPSVYSGKRASASTSALVPDAAANRASVHSTATRPIQSLRRVSRASTSSESSSSSSSSEDSPLALRVPPRPGSAMSRAPGSPARHSSKPLIDIGELVGSGNTSLPIRTTVPLKDSSDVVKADSPTARSRKVSLGIGERLSALASGFSGSQPSRPKSPESVTDSRDEGFTPPEVPKVPRSPSPIPSSSLSSPISPIGPASRVLGRKVPRSPPAIQMKRPTGPKVDTSLLSPDSGITPPPSSSTSSDTPIPYIKPRPIRERKEPPAFAVTSRPISHAGNLSLATLATVDNAVADEDEKEGPRRSGAAAITDQTKQDQQRPSSQQSQPDSQTTVRVVRGVPSKPPREDPLPVPRPHSRPPVSFPGVTVSNVRVTSPPLSPPRHGPASAPVALPPKPFALRDRSPVSSAGDSNSSRMPATPRDGSELGTSSTGRNRKRVSVTFADTVTDDRHRAKRSSVGNRPGHGRRRSVSADSSDDEDREREAEEKRKERRRSEAKAAIELGNVINGPGPIIDDDEDDDEEEQPMNVPPRMSMAMGMNQNHNIPFPTGVGSMGTQGQWGPSAATHFGNPLGNLSMHDLAHAGTGGNLVGNMGMASGMNMNMNMGMGMVDPRVFMAHQQAMLIAKQTYQLAVAQQAMRDAADEWERGSAISGWGGGRSSVGTPSVLGLGMGMGLNMNMNMNMNGGGGMGAGGFPGATAAAGGSLGIPNVDGMGWPIGGMAGFPAANSARPMFPGGGGGGGLYAASEFGGSGGAGGSDRGTGWATNSVYGESFGAPRDRSSRIATRQNQASSQHMLSPGSGASSPPGAKRDGPRPRTRTAPSSGGGAGVRTSAVPVPVKKRGGEGHGLVGPVSPPSSWKGQQ